MIRAKLEGIANIQALKFDIPGRQLEVYHAADRNDDFLAALESLHLDTTLISSEETDEMVREDDHHQQRRVLWQDRYFALC
jgi:hypothetical protein